MNFFNISKGTIIATMALSALVAGCNHDGSYFNEDTGQLVEINDDVTFESELRAKSRGNNETEGQGQETSTSSRMDGPNGAVDGSLVDTPLCDFAEDYEVESVTEGVWLECIDDIDAHGVPDCDNGSWGACWVGTSSSSGEKQACCSKIRSDGTHSRYKLTGI